MALQQTRQAPQIPEPKPFKATEAFLRAFKQNRGDVEATLKALGVKAGRHGT